MTKLLNYFQRLDPGFPALKRSLKTFAAIVIVLVIYRNDPRMAIFAAITALLVSRSQTGITLGERRFTLLITGLLLTILSVPVSMISANNLFSVVFITVFAFFTFFLMGLKMVPDFPAIVVLSVSVVEMAFSHSVRSGIDFLGLYLLVTALVFVVHFILFPTRPLLRLQSKTAIISKHLQQHFHLLFSDFHSLEEAIPIIHKSNDALKNNIRDFRRLWQLFNVSATDDSAETSGFLKSVTYYEKIHGYLILIWQYRAASFASPVYRRFVLEQPLIQLFTKQITEMNVGSITESSKSHIVSLMEKLSNLENDYSAIYEKSGTVETTEEWLAVFSTIRALLAMANEVLMIAPEMRETGFSFSVKQKTIGFFTMLRSIPEKIGFQNPAFRFGLRSAFIIGSTMAVYRFFNISYGYWLVLFAVLLIRPNVGISVKTGLQRLTGTLIGSILAFLILMAAEPETWLFYLIVILNLFFMIWFTNLDKHIPMVVSLTFLIIALFSIIYPGEGDLAFLRIVYTAGIVVAVVFLTSVIWPDRARLRLGEALSTALSLEKSYFRLILRNYSQKTEQVADIIQVKQQIETQINHARQLFEAAKHEVLRPGMLQHGRHILVYIQRIFNSLHSLDKSVMMCHSSITMPEKDDQITLFAENIEKAFDVVATAIVTYGLPEGYPSLVEKYNELTSSLHLLVNENHEKKTGARFLLQNTYFFWNLKPLILELEGIKHEILMKMKAL